MRALVVERLGPDYSGCALKEVPTSDPGPGEVRVRVIAAAVNFPDLLMTRGEYQHKPALPFIPGLEIAGEIEALGEGVEDRRVGEAVVGAPSFGGISQFAVAPATALRPKPARLSFAQAAACGVAYLTAWVSLFRRGQVEAGEWVLVHGAAGGVGLACVDLAGSLGCRVIAASASDDKLSLVRAEYAPDATVNVTGGFRGTVKAITGGRGADIICDPVGGDVFDESVRCIAFGGRLLTIGFASGRVPTLPVNLALIKGFSLVGVRAGEYGRQNPERARENLDAVWALADEGKIRPRVHAEFPLADWRAAFDLLATRAVIGKAVIRPDL